jgi:hypothetical protein
MSKRSLQDKKLRKLRKALRPPTASYINLIDWLRDRGYANTVGEAEALLLSGKVKVESHTVGRVEQDNPLKPGNKEWVVQPLTPAGNRKDIIVNA